MIYSKLNAKMDKGKFNLTWNTYNQHLKEMLQNMLEASDLDTSGQSYLHLKS